MGLLPLDSGLQEGRVEFFCILWCSLSHQRFLYSDLVSDVLCLGYALLRLSLAASFVAFSSFPNVTTRTFPSILLKTSASQSFFFFLHLHPYHITLLLLLCFSYSYFLIYVTSFLSGQLQYDLHESWSVIV